MRGSMEIHEISITEDAFEVIVQALRQAREESLELGGSLLVHEKEGRALVVYAVPTGPQAQRGPGHLRTDADFQNDAIRRVRAIWPGLSYAGDWHIHPMYLPELSGTDRATARAILNDDETRRDQLVLLLATARRDGPPVLLGFVVRLVRAGTLQIDKLPIARVAGDSPEVLAALGRPLPSLADVLSGAAGSQRSEDVPRISEDATARLIEDDLADVRASLGAEAHLWQDDELLGAVIRKGGREAFVVFPPEYPLGAPQVFAGALGDEQQAPVPLSYGWSSLHRLVDPVACALDRPRDQPERTAEEPADALPWVLVGALLRWVGLHSLAALIAPRDSGPAKRQGGVVS